MDDKEYLLLIINELKREVKSITTGNISHKIPSIIMGLDVVKKYIA